MEMKPGNMQPPASVPPWRKKNFVSRLSSELQSILWLEFSVGCVSHVSFKSGLGHPTSLSLFIFLILFLPSLVPSLDLRKTRIGSASGGLTMPSG